MSLHSLLRRQLKKVGASGAEALERERVALLLDAINAAYAQYDDDRRMLERSLELSSRELLQANADLRALLESLPDLFLRLDVHDVITDCKGPPPSEFLGHSRVIGRSLADVLSSSTWNHLRTAVGTVRTSRERLTLEYSEQGPHGAEHFEARLTPIFEDQVILILRNITALKRAEESIARERAFLRQVIDLDPNFVFAKDREGRFTLANQAIADAYGTTVEGLLGKRDADFNGQSTEVEQFLTDDQRVMDSLQEIFIPEERITDATGRSRWLQTVKRPIVGPDGQAHHVLGVAADITQRRKAQEALERRTTQMLRQQAALKDLATSGDADSAVSFGRACTIAAEVLGLARASIWILDADRQSITCTWLFADGALLREPGLRLTREAFPAYFAALENSLVIAAHDARTDPRTCAFADSYLTPLGITSMLDCAVLVNGITVGVLCLEHVGPPRHWTLEEQDFATAVASFVAVSHAIEQRRHLEEQLRHSQKMEAVGVLAGGVAHDFNNLLTAILGFAGLVVANPRLDQEAQHQMGEIIRAGQRASELTSQLLAFGRKQVQSPRVIGLNALLENVGRLLRRLIGEQIEFRTEPADREVYVRVDPHQLEQVLLNLVVNARDAMRDAHGVLTITVGHADAPAAGRDTTQGSGRHAVLTVRDTGAGIPEDVLPRVFEPFFTTKGVGEGTGLGLAMVYGIVQQSGGHIELHSTVGVGTTARVLLPEVEGAPEPAPVVTSPDGVLRGGTETVLLVEDEAIVRLLAVQLLERLGYRTLVAARPTEAIAILQDTTQHIDLLITDLVMPEMNGRELHRRAAISRPALRVLYISGYAPSGVLKDHELEPGAQFLAKPFTLKQLADRVRDVIDTEPAAVPAL